MKEKYIYLSSHNAVQLRAHNCKGQFMGTIMSCFDGDNDDDEQDVIDDNWTEDSPQWITGFAVDKYGNLYVASYESFIRKYLPSKNNEKFYRKQCLVFRQNLAKLQKQLELDDEAHLKVLRV